MVDLTSQAKALADGIEAALPAWVVRCVDRIHRAWAGSTPAGVLDEAVAAGEAARQEAGSAVRALLLADIDEQRTTPLEVVRRAVAYPTGVLRRAGVPPVVRDEFAEAAFPDDVYGLTPATFADVDPGLGEPALAWGAAKAWVHRERHRGQP
jgi:hypothetical protein